MRLDETCFLQCDEGATLFHGLEAASGYAYGDLLADLRNEKSLLLEIDLAAALAGRVELGSTDTVRIPAAYLGFCTCYVANSSHIALHATIVATHMQITDTLFLVVVLIFSAVVHEVMHGVAADQLGDPTARYAGRLTLNPIPHLDPVGSIILPLMLAFSGSPFFFAWAKPVPYNPYNLRPGRFSEAIVAAAGPLSNLAIALLTGLITRFVTLPAEVSAVLVLIIVVNVMLFLFNLIPIPPLDGSKILSAVLPKGLAYEYDKLRFRLESSPFLGMGIVLVIILFFGTAFGNFVFSLASAIAGV